MPRRQFTDTRHGAAADKASPSPEAASSGTAPGATTSSTQLPSHFKKRVPLSSRSSGTGLADGSEMTGARDERRPLLDGRQGTDVDDGTSTMTGRVSWIHRNQWIVLAMASGACAAFNGVFAKLTTTELTTSFSQWIARLLNFSEVENVIEVIVRSMFFGLNLVFNGVMWTLFTNALTRGNSTTQVSIINTSSNFVITAILGVAIFSEALPPLWWLGAAMLVAGNVIIGRKDEGLKGTEDDSVSSFREPDAEDGQGTYHRIPGVEEPIFIPRDEKDDDEGILDLGVEGTQ